MLDFHRQKLN